MAHKFSEKQLAIFEETFSHFDKDGDGTVTPEELGMALRSLEHVLVHLGESFTDEKIEAMIKEADVDENGKMDYHEFGIVTARRLSTLGSDIPRAAPVRTARDSKISRFPRLQPKPDRNVDIGN
ncbi:UNVERIFIED_CONTAM: hypothetical protein K2H54_077104 [Gekko kuhli]